MIARVCPTDMVIHALRGARGHATDGTVCYNSKYTAIEKRSAIPAADTPPRGGKYALLGCVTHLRYGLFTFDFRSTSDTHKMIGYRAPIFVCF